MNKLIGSQYFVAQFLWTYFFLSCWTNDVTNFPKVMNLMSSPNCYLRFSIVVLETLKFEWQCSQYLELKPSCANYNDIWWCFLYAFRFRRITFPSIWKPEQNTWLKIFLNENKLQVFKYVCIKTIQFLPSTVTVSWHPSKSQIYNTWKFIKTTHQ